jgi:very-short-patch-repair endonuclease/DNA polymerase III delta prime subunit
MASISEESKLAAAMSTWQRKLLDVSRRNRAINFKPNKVTTVAIVDEQPGEVFRQLYLQERSMRFTPKLEKDTKEAPNPLQTVPMIEENEDTLTLHFVPYSVSELSEKHTDDALQTALVPEKLDVSLRRIDEQARASLEEQGVNTLFLALGMLHYKESKDSEEICRAPLIMLPVELSRRNARSVYTVQAADDEPIVNPSLTAYLRNSFGVQLPTLPDLSNVAETYDLQSFFAQVIEAIERQEGWELKRDIFLSFFSFEKFLMYKDLESKAASFANHPIIKQLVLRSGSSIRGLPQEIRSAELDQEFLPESTAQVVNADASQLRAILAVSKGHPLVIEGPPGTGKSQTITNLIAQALAENKTVLFVAEKMAALNVVHSRLKEAGMGEFCLEIHSTSASKRTVLQDIGTALDASLQQPKSNAASKPIAALRQELTTYTRAVHAPHGALELSPYRVYGEFERVRQAPKLPFTKPVDSVSHEALENTERDLRDLVKAVELIGIPAQHPWRDTSRTFYSEQDLDTTKVTLENVLAIFRDIKDLASKVQSAFSLPEIKTFADVRTAVAIAEVMSRSPGAPLAVLQSEAWNSPPPQATDLVTKGQKLQRMREYVEQRFKPEAQEREHKDDVAFVESKENSPLRMFNGLNGSYRAIKKRWLVYRLPSYQGTLLEQATDMTKADTLARARTNLVEQNSEGQQLFGALWQGETSNWDALENYIRWVTEFRRICVDAELEEQALLTATKPRPDISLVDSLSAKEQLARQGLETLITHLGWTQDYFGQSPFDEITQRLSTLEQSLNAANRWGAFEAARAKVARGLASELLEPVMNGEIAFTDLEPAFKRAFFQTFLNNVIQQREALRNFNTLLHERRIQEFKQLDDAILSDNRLSLVRSLRQRTQQKLQTREVVESLPFLRSQLARQRGISPLRILFRRSLAAIRAIKPILMMSPLSVAQLLDGEQTSFDLVIFDEASQLRTEDAVGAILRGKQLVVVGDPKQLPPTNFFAVSSGTVDVPLDEDGLPIIEDSQSILEEFMASGAPMARLKWHYRSSHESLIHFSNVSFYESDLYTFPSVQTNSHASGLSFEHVPNGIYEGKGLNMNEARRVADAVVEHAKTSPKLSLGVGTFNMRQQVAIQDLLEEHRRQDPSLESFFARNKSEPFFVKNLENIQGDERDVIFLSVTYAKNADGVLRYNFGPLNGENGWRRLNVITTRARKSMKVFSSMKGYDINPVHTTSQGPKLLRDFLLYAEHGRLDGTAVSVTAEMDSPFEREVYQELTKRGLDLQPQIGVAGYRIDFGVRDPELPGRYLCGLECDGMSYHSSETARDRDRLRQQVLESRGWVIHRVWSTDWFKDRSGQIERLLGLIEKTREMLKTERAAEEEEHKRLLEEAERLAQEVEVVQVLAIEDKSSVSVEEGIKLIAYSFAPTPSLYNEGFAEAPGSHISRVIEDVIKVEAPLHLKDLASRVVAHWGYDRAGSAMMQRIQKVVHEMAQAKKLLLRGEFVFGKNLLETPVRSRAGTGIPAERIAPEEYRAAIEMILQAGDGFDRKVLTNKVRSLFGFNRTGANLEAAIGGAIAILLEEGTIGEGSTGIKLRELTG